MLAVLWLFPNLSFAQSCGTDAFSNPVARSGVFATNAVTIAAVGDVMTHRAVQRNAASIDRGYGAHYASVAPFLSRADITIGNLETPLAENLLPGGRETTSPPRKIFDDRVYSGYPTFNAHPSLAAALKSAGFDVLQTANNHALDRGPAGVDRTIAALRSAGLSHTGTRAQSDLAGAVSRSWLVRFPSTDCRTQVSKRCAVFPNKTKFLERFLPLRGPLPSMRCYSPRIGAKNTAIPPIADSVSLPEPLWTRARRP